MDWMIALLNSSFIEKLFSPLFLQVFVGVFFFGGLIARFAWNAVKFFGEIVINHFTHIEESFNGLNVKIGDLTRTVSEFKTEMLYANRSMDKRLKELEAIREAHTYRLEKIEGIIKPKEG